MSRTIAASASTPGARVRRRLRWLVQPVALPVAAFLCLWCLLAPASAQTVRDIVIDQNSVLQRFTPPPARPPGIGVTVVTDDVVGIAPEALDSVRFTLRDVRIEGAVTLDPALFTPLYAKLVGRTITLRDIDGVLKGIEEIYRENDYYARAFAPQQDLAGGTVRIVVYESYIREVSIEGDVHRIRNLEARIQPYIDRMVAMRPVRISQLIRYALLMSDLAGLTIEARFSQIPEEPGAGRLVLRLDFDPSSFGVRLDNFASPDVGPLELAGQARFNNLFGLFESTEVVVVTNPAVAGGARPSAVSLRTSRSGRPASPSATTTPTSGRGPAGDEDIRAETEQANVNLEVRRAPQPGAQRDRQRGLRAQDTDVDVDRARRSMDQRKRWVTFGATYDDTILGVDAIVEAELLARGSTRSTRAARTTTTSASQPRPAACPGTSPRRWRPGSSSPASTPSPTCPRRCGSASAARPTAAPSTTAPSPASPATRSPSR
jgi:hemolysin activation/secretion protein